MDVPANAVVETAEAVETAVEVADVTVEAADADDEALLDLIALEMSAPDPDDIDEAPAAPPDDIRAEIRSAEPRPAEPGKVAEMAGPIAAPAVQASLEPSLGSSLVANGIVRRPRASDADPLAPIRRMSPGREDRFLLLSSCTHSAIARPCRQSPLARNTASACLIRSARRPGQAASQARSRPQSALAAFRSMASCSIGLNRRSAGVCACRIRSTYSAALGRS